MICKGEEIVRSSVKLYTSLLKCIIKKWDFSLCGVKLLKLSKIFSALLAASGKNKIKCNIP